MLDGLVKPTLAVDFDGVLNSYASGYQPDYVPDPPVRGALAALESYAEVFQIVLFTTRASEPEGVAAIVDWINRNGFTQIPLTITAEKPVAHVYLDDRGWQFPGPGQFPTAAELLEFRPWWDTREPAPFPDLDASTAAKAVASLAARAAAAEPTIADAVTRAVEFVGGSMAGAEDRLKASPTIAGKIAAVMAEKDYSLEQAAADIKDSLRFTAVFDADRYAAATAAVITLLEHSAGLELVRLRNYWLPDQGGSRYAEGTYIGINAVFAAPNGFLFELQFHTPQSAAVQAINWDFYRLIRSGNLEPAEQEQIEAQMRENNGFVTDPAKVAAVAPVVAAAAMRADGEGVLPAIVHYRETANHDRSCATCSFYGAGTAMRCGMFDTLVSPAMVCDEWAEGLPGALPEQWQWSDLEEVTPPLVSAAPGVTSLSTMIAVKPRIEEAEAIAAPGGDPPENLHVTLAFLGEIDGDLEPVVDALRIVAAEHAPLEGVVGGYGAFDPPGVGILLPDVRGLVELRTAVCEALIAAEIDYSRDHGFEAHLTVTDPDTEPTEGYPESAVGGELHFDDLLVVRGDDEIHAIPLTGARPVTASALVAAAEPFCLPAELRGKTDPIRQAFVKAVMTPALEQAGLTWDITNPLAADVISRAGAHIVGIAQTTQNDVMNVINVAHDQGLSIPDTAKAIRMHMKEASQTRATMIARTELAAAVNGGSLAATKIAADATGATATKTWMTAPGAMYPRHEDYEGLDGQTVGLDEMFDVGGNPFSYPGDPDGDPGDSINCFPAETLVEFPALRAVLRRRYEGDLVRVRLSTGHELAGTPNHPVLRADGVLVPLREVKEGDDLVRAAVIRNGMRAPDPDDPPATISEVYRLARMASDPERIRLAPPDLHGDALDGEVDVVRTDGSLLIDREAATDKQVAEIVRAFADAAHSTFGPGGSATDAEFGGKSGVIASFGPSLLIGGSGERTAIIRGETLHPDLVRLGSATEREIELAESPNNRRPADIERAAERQHAFAAHVSLAEVVKVEVEPFHGEVFTLDTGQGWFTAGSVICGNCRCTLEYSGGASDTAGQNIDAAGERSFSIEHHNRILRKAYARVDELEPKLAAVLLPILERAGEVAARRFEQLATDHLTAADDPANPAGWTPPAAEEILPINCEENADALGITSGNAEAGVESLAAPPAGGPGGPGSVVSFAQTTDFDAFNAALSESARPGFLNVHTPEELARDKVFVSPDGASGFVVTPEGDLQNVFRNAGGVKGAGQQAVRTAVQEEGATTLDAYDGFLPDLYQQEGFRIVGRMKWEDEFAPDGWEYDKYGRPDIVFMAQNPADGTEVRTFTDWDEAKAYSASVAGPPIDPEILDASKSMVARATELEPATTAELSSIAKDLGGEMSGLDFAVKSNVSLTRKIMGDLADAQLLDPAATVQDVASTINDTLRYTMTFSPADYSGGVNGALERLKADGFTQVKLKNYWGNADYQGINGVFEKDGYRFELQFHTPDSFELKTSLHEPYEAYRAKDATLAQKLDAWNEMAAEQSKLDVPPDVLSIGDKVIHPPPAGVAVQDVRTVETIVPGANNLTMDRTMENINYNAERQAANTQGGITVDQWKDEALASLQRAVADAEVRVRVTPDALDGILDDGRFKSQFETGSSKGTLDPDLRAKAEEKMFGYPKDLRPEERPIYGYLAGSAGETGGVSGYGDLIVNLKPETNARTTFSLIDSLGPGRDGEIIPSPLSDPSLTSWWCCANVATADGDIGEMTYGTYSEAQIHGGVTIDDIAEVLFSAEKEQEEVDGAVAVANIKRDEVVRLERELEEEKNAEMLAPSTEERPNLAIGNKERALNYARDDAEKWLAISEEMMMQGANLRARLDELGIKWRLLDNFRDLGGGNPDFDLG